MHISKRINLPIYLSFVLLSTTIASLFANTFIEIVCIVVVAIAALANQFLLFVGVQMFVRSATVSEKQESKKLRRIAILFQILKFLILVLSLSLSVQFMGKRVIIPLSNYFVILLFFAFSFKKDR